MDLSVVVPIHNEVDNLEPVQTELGAVLDRWGRSAEVIYVDDGSSDGSFEVLRRLQSSDPRMRVVQLSRNFGQTAALAAGIAHAGGDIIVLMDGDGQNDPAEIPRLLEEIAQGNDLVAGWRLHRRDALWSRRIPSMAANWLIGVITGVSLHDYGCTLKAIRGDLARGLRLYGEMHRFIPALAADLGARIVEIPVNHRPRLRGQSKYGLSRTVRVILDLVTVKFLSSYSTRPIHIFGLVGLIATSVGLFIVGWLGMEKLLLGVQLATRPLLWLGILLSIMGMQFVTMGLLGELLVRTYHESQGKPVYRISRTIP
ncbi:MAG TPA: glycosyltransferase family 2 protein [Candidatus Binatia bacterium]|nr:glycosyltransferase family 2 protein [Candidatus Binatia bacterium]